MIRTSLAVFLLIAGGMFAQTTQVPVTLPVHTIAFIDGVPEFLALVGGPTGTIDVTKKAGIISIDINSTLVSTLVGTNRFTGDNSFEHALSIPRYPTAAPTGDCNEVAEHGRIAVEQTSAKDGWIPVVCTPTGWKQMRSSSTVLPPPPPPPITTAPKRVIGEKLVYDPVKKGLIPPAGATNLEVYINGVQMFAGFTYNIVDGVIKPVNYPFPMMVDVRASYDLQQ